MIKVIAKMTIKEGMLETLKSTVAELIAETRKEIGCITYQLFQDVNNKSILSFVEEWESHETLKAHMNSKHFLESMPKLSGLLEKEMEVNVCTLVI